MRNGIASRAVRTLFISDVHLGSRYCHPRPLAALIRLLSPERLYIVGDFCDGWLLRRNWRWPQDYIDLVESIRQLSEDGSEVVYLLGNHDRCLQRWICEWGDFRVVEKSMHCCRDGRRLLLIHGDQFDVTQTRFRRAANMSARLHESVLGGSRIANRFLSEFGVTHRRLTSALTMPIKSIAHSLGQFHSRARQLAALHGCCGIVSGHTHTPLIRQESDFLFINTGDWLEHCSVVVETADGQLELWSGSASNWFATCRRDSFVVPATRVCARDGLLEVADK